MARADPPMVGAFVAELARKLQGKGSALALPLTWIEQRLSETGLTIEQLVQSAMQQQAADQVSISNSIRSLRSLGATDWKNFVEGSSAVEKTLREDPAGCYGKMDFATRDLYRHVVEETARRGHLSEVDVARFALGLARERCLLAGAGDRAAHIGYYLIDRGLRLLKRDVRVRASLPEALRNMESRTVLALYVGSSAILSLLIAAFFFMEARAGGLSGLGLWLTALLSFICAAGPSLSLVNWATTTCVAPRPLPRMDFSEGIPAESVTLVAVPAMLSSAAHVDLLVETLEIRFLANRDDNLLFGLLTDLPDAEGRISPPDKALIDLARRKIEELNGRYAGPSGAPFFLLHRGRRWNEHEGLWMGQERKRGKLSDLNALLRGDAGDRFDLVVGQVERLQTVKYVITLDTDTQLPRDCARLLAGTMAHPLNRARYDKRLGRVVEGYGILQPRVAASLPGAGPSLYMRLNGSEPGIDPYTRAVSDVYQDLFGEGSFIGKGIYDVDAFERALKGRLPDNRILSHDLLEGCYARSGLVSDVQLFEAALETYRADVDRRRRWMRGDWQIARWLLPSVPASGGRREKNPLSALSKWKLFDNLRRSLASTALTLLFLLGWAILPDSLLWTASAVALIFLPALVVSVFGSPRRSSGTRLGPYLAAAMRASGLRLAQAAFALLCLPYDAYLSLSSIFRSAWRMLVTHRHLLEWVSSDEHDRGDRGDLAASMRSMWFAPALAAAAFAVLRLSASPALLSSLPILALWLASPALTWWMSRPFTVRPGRLSAGQNDYLRRLSRKTWSFFETFVNAEEHWLPPDNYQELPAAKIAHRSSPTNMGLSLLANLAAHDFGYISTGRLIERTSLALDSMKVRSIAALVVGGLIAAALIVIPVRAASAGDTAKSPEPATAKAVPPKVGQDFIAGFDTGLYRVSADGSKAAALWQGGEVKKILRCSAGWYFLTSKGILFSPDLASFDDRSAGLPVKTYKVVKDGKKEFSSEVQDLKDIAIDPKEPARLLTCTKDSVYYSKDGGAHWTDLGTPISTTGLKAVAFAPYPGTGETAVWASHPIKGVFARRLGDPKSGWAPANGGLADLPGTTSVEEVADLSLSPDSAQLWASNSFLPRIYRYDDAKKTFSVV